MSLRASRLKMKPWLQQKISSGKVPGLRWLNKEKTEFRVPWKHAGKPDFNLEKDAALFRAWAEHTGKYKPGEQPDPSTWKTRFRCALRKQPDITEVRTSNSLDENEPYRVFRIINRGNRSPSRSRVSLVTPPTLSSDDVMELESDPERELSQHTHGFDDFNYNPFSSPDSSYPSSPSDDDDIDNITPTLPGLVSSEVEMSDYNHAYSQPMSAAPQTSEYFGFNSHVTHDVCDDIMAMTSQQPESPNSLCMQDYNDLAAQLGFLIAFFGPAFTDMLAQQNPMDYGSTISEVYREVNNLSMLPNMGI